MNVEILSFDGCPNHGPAIRLINDILEEEGLTADVVTVSVPDEATARRIAFLGSPSIRVNGQDIEPAARAATDYGMACRTYEENGRRTGLPPRDMIRQAIREATKITACSANPPTIANEIDSTPAKTNDHPPSRVPFLMAGSVAAAFVASLCCTLPIIFALTGFSILGAAAFFESLRPYFLAVTAVLLGLGFYYAYRPIQQDACAPSTTCAIPSNRRGARIALWAITALALVLAAFPYYSGSVAEILLTGRLNQK